MDVCITRTEIIATIMVRCRRFRGKQFDQAADSAWHET
jgi:hypothetical protein